MISKAELQYVQAYARYAPFPGKDYALSVMNDLEAAHRIYLSNYDEKKYNLILSDGE